MYSAALDALYNQGRFVAMPETIAGTEILSLEETRALMRKKLRGFLPEFEIDYKAEFAYKINKLKKERNAVILGHNYIDRKSVV